MHATEFVHSYFNAWNHLDPESVADHLANDGRYCDIPENSEWTHDELITSLYRFFDSYRHRYELVGEVLADRNTIAFQYRMIPVNGGRNTAEKTYHGAEFITLRNDAAVIITDYYDIPDVRRPSVLRPLRPRKTRPRKYAKSGLDDQQLLGYKARLENIMRSQQLFLQADLTLPKLAEAVDCSVNHLSQVINSGFGMNFFDYLNKYRVECAMELMARPDNRSRAILGIAYTVGFNSNSAFYAAFKKYVGQTPAHYRRDQLQAR